LLDIFLRFLRYHEAREHTAELQAPAPRATGSPAWLVGEGSDLLEGSAAGANSGADAGFGWQRGDERCTTGMWMWGRAFVLPRRTPGASAGAPSRRVAVLLMDMQGLGDSETTRRLTNAIFGLSSTYAYCSSPIRP
jgi:Guanylate-binding protein, N-terminal domain